MIDIVNQINDIQREVAAGRLAGHEGHSIILRRRYDAEIEDVWDACTNAERIKRWFLPISGDLRLGGTYQLEGNAGGEIVHCEPPRMFRVTWVFGDPGDLPPSEVEVRLAPADDGHTLFELEHTAVVPAEFWDTYGPGATGVGWDLGLLGLGLHLSGGTIPDHHEFEKSPEAKEYTTRSSEAWGMAYEKFGASPEVAASAVQQTTAFYTGETPAS
jgi:uncharacterized protein YndB with AHSA1/START domain